MRLRVSIVLSLGALYIGVFPIQASAQGRDCGVLPPCGYGTYPSCESARKDLEECEQANRALAEQKRQDDLRKERERLKSGGSDGRALPATR